MKELVEEVEKWDIDPQTSQSLVDKHLWEREKRRHGDRNRRRKTHTFVRRRVQDPGVLVQSCWENADLSGGKDAERQKSVGERREARPMQKCAVENQVPKNDRPGIQSLLLRM